MRVDLAHRPDERRVEVTAGGEPFTSYRWDDRDVLTKPVCYPVVAADGRAITRGYPMDPRRDERVDHPHHVGVWLAYGNVNGYDFWNNSGGDQAGLGRIRHDGIERVECGNPAELVARADWIDDGGRRHLREETTYRFCADGDRRWIDRATLLTADRDVDLGDDKEGMLGLRVRSGLEHPGDGEITVVDDPEAGTTRVVDAGTGRSGRYLTGEDVEGVDAWGTRASWVRLAGDVEGDPAAVTIMDHPENVGHPTYWHARGYGLFAANPLGQAVLSDGEERLDFGLDAGESTRFRHRVSVDVDPPAPDTIEERYWAFADSW